MQGRSRWTTLASCRISGGGCMHAYMVCVCSCSCTEGTLACSSRISGPARPLWFRPLWFRLLAPVASTGLPSLSPASVMSPNRRDPE